MIKLSTASDKNNVTSLFIGIEAKHPVQTILWFEHVCASQVERDLLREHIKEQIYEQMRRIRRLSYRRGWREKASKTHKKEDWFYSGTDITEWEEEAGR